MILTMQQELRLRVPYLADQAVETIYFGGGTPSLLSVEDLGVFITTVYENYKVVDRVEITMEANPDDITKESLVAWKKIGINRLSIGLQSFREEDLIWMNRAHTRNEALECVQLAKEAGFENISVDLIYGLPGLSLEDWKRNIQTVIDFGIQHVSAYCLTVEEKTALSKWVKEHKIIPANEDEQSEQFEILVSELARAGIEQYEISNFSIEGFHSQHNSNYWKAKHYLGIGPSAHSFNGVSRSWNIANNRQYISLFSEEKNWFETEILSKKDQFNELLLIGLRTSAGVNMVQLEAIQAPSDEFCKKINEMQQSEWLTLSNETIILTKSGKLKADYIASELFSEE